MHAGRNPDMHDLPPAASMLNLRKFMHDECLLRACTEQRFVYVFVSAVWISTCMDLDLYGFDLYRLSSTVYGFIR